MPKLVWRVKLVAELQPYMPAEASPHGFACSRNNRAEVSHQPIRRREREVQRLKSPGSAQRFVSMHSATYSSFNVQRHLISHRALRILRAEAMAQWHAATAVAA